MKFLLALLLAASASTGSSAGATPTTDDLQWVSRCVAYHTRNGATQRAARTYCVCMHGVIEGNEPLDQTEMERMYPPAHRMCSRRAGRG